MPGVYQQTRDEWKQLIKESRGRWALAYLDVDDDVAAAARNQLTVKVDRW